MIFLVLQKPELSAGLMGLLARMQTLLPEMKLYGEVLSLQRCLSVYEADMDAGIH